MSGTGDLWSRNRSRRRLVSMTTAEELEQRARDLIDDRMATVRALAQTGAEVNRAQDALDAALREHAAAWNTAQKAEWTAAELTRIGVPAPKVKKAPRARKQRSSASNEHAHDNTGQD